MAGNRGKGKASASKSKPKTTSVVSSVPEPVVAEESVKGPSDGGEAKIEIPSTKEEEHAEKKLEIPCTVTDEKENDEKNIEIPSMDTDEKENIDATFEENQLLADEGNDYENNGVENNDDEMNDDEKDITDEFNANEVDSLSGQTEEEEEVNDGDDADDDVDSENDGADTEEENTEEVSDGGGAVNSSDVEDDEEKPDEEVVAEVKEEQIDDCGGDKNINNEENKDMEVAEDGKIVTSDGLAVSEQHGVTDEEMMSKGTSDNLNAEEPLSASANNEKTAEERRNDGVSNNVEKAKKPKRKLVRKSLIEKVNDAKPQSSIVNDEEMKQTVTINKKLKRKRKPIVSESNATVGAAALNNEQGTEVVKEADKVEVEGEKVKRPWNSKASPLKKKRKQKVVTNDETKGNVVVGDPNKTGPSRKGKSKKGGDVKGMIFMCNGETKKDCYRYRVLGLPVGKKDFVLSIYKGMTLFLFDIELKMLYGIYKAAAPGGFDIEPRAFKSKFPSQVRFTVLEDCVPLAEEKFKGAIKENYFTKNKFDCKLNSAQVGKLCALFRETTRKADSQRIVRNPVEAAPSSQRDRKRKRAKFGREAGPASSAKRERRHPERDVRQRRDYERDVRQRRDSERDARQRRDSERDARQRRDSERYARQRRDSERDARQRRDSERDARQRRDSEREVRRGPAVVDDRYYQQQCAVVYDEREAYLPPTAPPPVQVVYQALPPTSLPQPSSYAYAGTTRDDIYRQEPVLERVPVRDLGLLSLARPGEADRRDPYASYKESRAADLYEPSATRDLYEPSARREHYDYIPSSGREVEYRATEYRPPPPAYRRY